MSIEEKKSPKLTASLIVPNLPNLVPELVKKYSKIYNSVEVKEISRIQAFTNFVTLKNELNVQLKAELTRENFSLKIARDLLINKIEEVINSGNISQEVLNEIRLLPDFFDELSFVFKMGYATEDTLQKFLDEINYFTHKTDSKFKLYGSFDHILSKGIKLDLKIGLRTLEIEALEYVLNEIVDLHDFNADLIISKEIEEEVKKKKDAESRNHTHRKRDIVEYYKSIREECKNDSEAYKRVQEWYLKLTNGKSIDEGSIRGYLNKK